MFTINHINLCAPMPELLEIKDFYEKIFDLVDGDRPAVSRRGFWLYAGDQAVIHLTESDKHQYSDTQGYLDHIAFRVTGLEKMVTSLNDLGVEYTHRYFSDDQVTQLFFKDPAGIRIEANFLHESMDVV